MSSLAWAHRGHHSRGWCSGRPGRPGSEPEVGESPPEARKQPKPWDPSYGLAVGRGGEVRGGKKGEERREGDDREGLRLPPCFSL